MPINIDHKRLRGFMQEAGSSLSKIREGIESFLRDPKQQEALEDAYQCMQSIKDASEMLGLQVLSDLTLRLEEIVEDIATAPIPLHETRSPWLRRAVDQFEGYLASACLTMGKPRSRDRDGTGLPGFKELPESGDKAAVQEILGVEVDISLHDTVAWRFDSSSQCPSRAPERGDGSSPR
jgi:chemotaxis protein histidine kinase CheA